ncbi:Protein of unknown function [Gryllus bimaculatus]|nr:Protein of unknown function [Gryllus bimaculatus]
MIIAGNGGEGRGLVRYAEDGSEATRGKADRRVSSPGLLGLGGKWQRLLGYEEYASEASGREAGHRGACRSSTIARTPLVHSIIGKRCVSDGGKIVKCQLCKAPPERKLVLLRETFGTKESTERSNILLFIFSKCKEMLLDSMIFQSSSHLTQFTNVRVQADRRRGTRAGEGELASTGAGEGVRGGGGCGATTQCQDGHSQCLYHGFNHPGLTTHTGIVTVSQHPSPITTTISTATINTVPPSRLQPILTVPNRIIVFAPTSALAVHPAPRAARTRATGRGRGSGGRGRETNAAVRSGRRMPFSLYGFLCDLIFRRTLEQESGMVVDGSNESWIKEPCPPSNERAIILFGTRACRGKSSKAACLRHAACARQRERWRAAANLALPVPRAPDTPLKASIKQLCLHLTFWHGQSLCTWAAGNRRSCYSTCEDSASFLPSFLVIEFDGKVLVRKIRCDRDGCDQILQVFYISSRDCISDGIIKTNPLVKEINYHCTAEGGNLYERRRRGRSTEIVRWTNGEVSRKNFRRHHFGLPHGIVEFNQIGNGELHQDFLELGNTLVLIGRFVVLHKYLAQCGATKVDKCKKPVTPIGQFPISSRQFQKDTEAETTEYVMRAKHSTSGPNHDLINHLHMGHSA